MSNTERTTRVRYGRLDNRKPKNTLVTVRDNDTVYFGIARCNVQLDTFHKNIGTYIAEQRARLARDDTQVYRYNTLDGTSVKLHESGLRGSVPVSEVKEVVRYFRDVDQYCLDNLTPRNVKV